MAGQPKTRARREAIPEAIDVPLAGAHAGAHHAGARTGARTPDRERDRAPASGGRPGPATRGYADQRAAGQMADLDEGLGQSVVVSIERLRPRWCAGWLEDADADPANLGELREYIADEWGGSAYRLTINGEERALKIAGPPKAEGRRVYREDWENERAPGRTAQPAQSQQPPQESTMINLLSLVMSEGRESRNAVLDSVKEMQAMGANNIQNLLSQLSANREQAQASTSFGAQVAELRQGMAAVKELKDDIAEDAPEPPEPTEDIGIRGHAERSLVDAITARFVGPSPTAQAPTQGQAAPPPNGKARGPIPEA